MIQYAHKKGEEYMNKNIEEYIEKAKYMDNKSQGGAPAYLFDDVVLIKYPGIREDEKLIAKMANQKRNQGIKTPYHLAMKKTEDSTWVLQEKAKGKTIKEYCKNEEVIKNLLFFAKVPINHYIKYIKDLTELIHMGIEPVSKNIFYEDKEEGGFTIIDLTDYDGTSMNPNSRKEVFQILKDARQISEDLRLSKRDTSSHDQLLEKELEYAINLKILTAMNQVIPNFSKHQRWLLRTLPKQELDFLNQNGIPTNNLSLTEEEYNEFDNEIARIAENLSIKKVDNTYLTTEIDQELDNNCLTAAWNYHKENLHQTKPTINIFEKMMHELEVKKELRNKVLSKITEYQNTTSQTKR